MAYDLIKEGQIGEIKTILENIHWGDPGLPTHYLTKAYGGVVLENGVHTLDHFCYLTGNDDWKVEHARVGNDNWRMETPDWGEATLSTNKHVAHASWLWPKSFTAGMDGYTVTLIGTEGKLTIFGFDGLKLEYKDGIYEHHFYRPSKVKKKDIYLAFLLKCKHCLEQ